MNSTPSLPNLLFVHHNYPAQFNYLIDILIPSFNITFISDALSKPVNENISHIRVPLDLIKSSNSFTQQLSRAEAYRLTFKELSESGYNPQYIISHSGWGSGLHLRNYFIRSKIICYSEWWFSTDCPEYSFKLPGNTYRYSTDSIANLRMRNCTFSQELLDCDLIVCPTTWQANQLPSSLFSKVIIIGDPIPTDYYIPNLSLKNPHFTTVTYASRGLEDVRCFSQFLLLLRNLPALPTTRFIIAGQDRAFYGSNSSSEFELASLKIPEINLSYVGFLKPKSYLRLLQKTDVFLYLTRPFVLSWGLLNAMSCGAKIITNKVETSSEYVSHNPENLIFNFDNFDDVIGLIVSYLENKDIRDTSLGNRQLIVERNSFNTVKAKWLEALGALG